MTTTNADVCFACHEPWSNHSCRLGVQKLLNESDALRAKLEAAEHQIHRLEREIEEASKRTTLISETSAARQTKLEIAMRALEVYAKGFCERHYTLETMRGSSRIHSCHCEQCTAVSSGATAHQALAQLEEQP